MTTTTEEQQTSNKLLRLKAGNSVLGIFHKWFFSLEKGTYLIAFLRTLRVGCILGITLCLLFHDGPCSKCGSWLRWSFFPFLFWDAQCSMICFPLGALKIVKPPCK
jgi:hypothetical protein